MDQHPLGIVAKDENKTEGMVSIMQEAQKYVPMVETTHNTYVSAVDKTVEVVKARTHLIQFSGKSM